MAAPLAVVAKKAAEILVSSKKGRKFLGYVVGIALFLVLLPVIVLYALFGGITGGGDSALLASQIGASLSAEQQAQLAAVDSASRRIAEVFADKGLTAADTEKANEIYIALLIGKEESESFCDDLAWCFESVSEDASLYDNLAVKFAVTFTNEEKAYLDEKYGVTIAGPNDSGALVSQAEG